MIMKKAVAFGLFVISILIGSTFVVVGTTGESDLSVWTGMLLIALGTINLAFKIIVPQEKPHVTLKVVEPVKVKKVHKKKKKQKKKSRK